MDSTDSRSSWTASSRRSSATASGILCGGGARLPSAAAKAAGWGLSGLEFGINIPGTAGGAVRMNANAYGGQLARGARVGRGQHRRRDRAPRPGAARLRLPAAPTCGAGEVVSRASFRLRPGDPEAIRATLATMRERRREAQPSGIKTFGSTFKNPEDERAEGRSAGQLLEAAGCRGLAPRRRPLLREARQLRREHGRGEHRRRAGADGRGPAPRPRAFGVELEPEVQVLGEVALAQRLGAVSRRLLAGGRGRPGRDRRRRSSPRRSSATRRSTGDGPGAGAGGDDRQRRRRGRGRPPTARSSAGGRCPKTPSCRSCRWRSRRRAAGWPARCWSRRGSSAPPRRPCGPTWPAAATAKAGWTWKLRSGIELRFGDASQAERKWKAAAAVLADPVDRSARLCRPARPGAARRTVALGIRFRPHPEPSTKGLGWAKSQVGIETLALQDACRPFDRGATMPYVQRNFRT